MQLFPKLKLTKFVCIVSFYNCRVNSQPLTPRIVQCFVLI